MNFRPVFPNLAERSKRVAAHPNAAAIRRAVSGFKPAFPPRVTVDGVFKGGGALGAAYAGALRVLSDNRIWFARVAGTSAGAITAAMIATGFTAEEIQWLCSAYNDALLKPETLSTGIDHPIDFESFLDLASLDQIKTKAKRSSLLWNALNGTVIDEVAKIQLPIRSRADLADRMVDAVLDLGLKDLPGLGDLTVRELFKKIPGNQTAPLKDAVESALKAAGYPRTPPRVGDIVPMADATAPFRAQFADTVWTAIAMNEPMELLLTQFLYEGSLFEGDVFLSTLRKLFGLRRFTDADRRVYFSDLKIPLAVIATNLETGRMEVYSSERTPTMEVAMAVRRSMSIPFVFQPVGGDFETVDGGLCSNFPVWLFSPAAEVYWPAVSRDNARPKIGFAVDEQGKPRAEWNVQSARFKTVGTPEHVDIMPVIKPILATKLRELHKQCFAGLMADTERNRVFDEVADRLGKVVVIREAMQMLGIDKENVTREVTTKAMMASLSYFDVVIPLLGYHWLDFGVNGEEDPLIAMWDRSWHATMDALGTAPSTGTGQALIANANAQQSPYKVS